MYFPVEHWGHSLWRCHLIGVNITEETTRQCLLCCTPAWGVKGQHTVKQVQRWRGQTEWERERINYNILLSSQIFRVNYTIYKMTCITVRANKQDNTPHQTTRGSRGAEKLHYWTSLSHTHVNSQGELLSQAASVLLLGLHGVEVG